MKTKNILAAIGNTPHIHTNHPSGAESVPKYLRADRVARR